MTGALLVAVVVVVAGVRVVLGHVAARVLRGRRGRLPWPDQRDGKLAGGQLPAFDEQPRYLTQVVALVLPVLLPQRLGNHLRHAHVFSLARVELECEWGTRPIHAATHGSELWHEPPSRAEFDAETREMRAALDVYYAQYAEARSTPTAKSTLAAEVAGRLLHDGVALASASAQGSPRALSLSVSPACREGVHRALHTLTHGQIFLQAGHGC